MPPRKRKRISIVSAGFLLLFGLIIDAAEVIFTFLLVGIGLDTVISVGAWLILFFWFYLLLDVNPFGNSRRTLTFVGAMGLEAIPLVNDLPGWTSAIWLMIRDVWREDKEFNKAQEAAFANQQAAAAASAQVRYTEAAPAGNDNTPAAPQSAPKERPKLVA